MKQAGNDALPAHTVLVRGRGRAGSAPPLWRPLPEERSIAGCEGNVLYQDDRYITGLFSHPDRLTVHYNVYYTAIHQI